MKVSELIELNNRAHEILGWKGGGSMDLGSDVIEEGDLRLYLEVHSSSLKGGDLCENFNDLKAHLEALFGNRAAGFDFFEDEKSESGFSVAVPLAHFSIFPNEVRRPK
uniref:Uncharacterized protein n=1 Tax=viral metagenome TaxID=1070528 RepID=A0A6M3M545_9ZZZZ